MEGQETQPEAMPEVSFSVLGSEKNTEIKRFRCYRSHIRHCVPSEPGVYLIEFCDKILYVGMSKNLLKRGQQQRRNPFKGYKFNFLWEIIHDERERANREAELIFSLQPPANVIGKNRSRVIPWDEADKAKQSDILLESGMRKLLIQAAREAGSARQLAKQWGVSAQWISQVATGAWKMSNKLANNLGYTRDSVFISKEDAKKLKGNEDNIVLVRHSR